MCEVEIWIDVICRGVSITGPMCTLFARHSMPVRPNIGETKGFYQEKGSNMKFNVISSSGSSQESSIRVEVENITHYCASDNGKLTFNTSITCSEVTVASELDARMVHEFLTTQAGFSVDPYGINNLSL